MPNIITGTNFNDDGILNPILNGTAIDDIISGLAGNDILVSLGDNDTLDGGSGADTMTGGLGNDTYYVDNLGDSVVENAGQGTDRVFSSISYTLGATLENLTLTGTAASGTGNALNNILTGNAANNTLFGLAGNDTLSGLDGNDTLDGGLNADVMAGGLGFDIYYVDNVGDSVVENANQGTDRVFSSITHTLAANVENLTLTTAFNLNGTGNTLNNNIVGNAGANVISGLGGNDSLAGNAGNDTIRGGDGIDTINGGLNNDLLIGELGADELTGGVGQDNFRFNAMNQGVDLITDFVVVDDTIQILQAAFPVVNPATGLLGNLALGAINPGQFHTVGVGVFDANDYFIYNGATGALLFDRDGSGAANSVALAALPAGLAMTNNDIVIVA